MADSQSREFVVSPREVDEKEIREGRKKYFKSPERAFKKNKDDRETTGKGAMLKQKKVKSTADAMRELVIKAEDIQTMIQQNTAVPMKAAIKEINAMVKRLQKIQGEEMKETDKKILMMEEKMITMEEKIEELSKGGRSDARNRIEMATQTTESFREENPLVMKYFNEERNADKFLKIMGEKWNEDRYVKTEWSNKYDISTETTQNIIISIKAENEKIRENENVKRLLDYELGEKIIGEEKLNDGQWIKIKQGTTITRCTSEESKEDNKNIYVIGVRGEQYEEDGKTIITKENYVGTEYIIRDICKNEAKKIVFMHEGPRDEYLRKLMEYMYK
ncbi:golgin subfamily A member 6-like protein 22 [Onthophagus taurus]|uniref:golgin subfamily A member 6-like protein 22 n=1 Tax=Onthophagus taurus TaxID=166361 RepID=UPI0039BE5778